MIQKSKTNPLVSVIIPLFNQKKYISRAINSVLMQTYSPIEIIVVNDGSTDNPDEILNAYLDKIKIINQLNKGLAEARNSGIFASSGKYIQFLDADDTILKEKIMKQVEILEKNKDYSLTACRTILVDEEGKELLITRKYSKKIPTIEDFLIENQFPVHSVLVKKEVFNKVALFDSTMNPIEDWDLWIRVLLGGFNIICTNDVLVKYFQISGSMSTNATSMYNARMKLLDRYFEDDGSNDNFRKKVYSNAYYQCSQSMYRNEKTKEARELILKAIKLNPLILNNFYFFYNFKQLYKPMDLSRKCTLNDMLSAQQELLTILKQAEQMDFPFIKQWFLTAYSHYYFSFALSHLLMGNFRKFLFFSKWSLKNNFSYFTDIVKIIYEGVKRKI